MTDRPPRTRLARDEARSRYIRLALEEIQDRARAVGEAFDEQVLAADPEGAGVGPPAGVKAVGIIATVDANAVAARDGKTRGAITHLFGSQNDFQVAVMALGADSRDYGDAAAQSYPSPVDFESSYEWARAVGRLEAERGPHQRSTSNSYARGWVMWLTQLPYAMWSQWLSRAAAEEFDGYAHYIEHELVRPALVHFGEEPAQGLSATSIAVSWCTAIEGLWLSQTVTSRFAEREELSTHSVAENSLATIWRGSVQPAGRR